MNTIFNEMDHRLSVVKRWGILHTLQTQSVAEHCFNVARITERIASQWFGMCEGDIKECVMSALHHDDLEVISGDLPAMVKPYLDEESMQSDHSDLVRPYVSNPLVHDVVKLADKLEGYHFLAMEIKLGNTYASQHHREEWGIIQKLVTSKWPKNEDLLIQVMVFMQDCNNELSQRHSKRGR